MVGKDIAITSDEATQKGLTSSVKSSGLIIQIANQTFFEANHWLIHKRLKEVNLENDQDSRIVKNHGDVRQLLHCYPFGNQIRTLKILGASLHI